MVGVRHRSGGDGVGSTGMTSTAGATSANERRNVSDAAGVIVLGACAVWSLITAAVHDGRPEGVLLAVLAMAAGYASGRILGAVAPVAAPAPGLSSDSASPSPSGTPPRARRSRRRSGTPVPWPHC